MGRKSMSSGLQRADVNTRASNLSAMMAQMASLGQDKKQPSSDGCFPCCVASKRLRTGGSIDLDQPDSRGKTLLQYAAFMGHEECMAALLAGGANPNVQNGNGMTALHFAAASVMAGS